MKHVILAAGVGFGIAALRMLIISGLSNNTVFLTVFAVALFVYRVFYETLVRVRWLNASVAAGAAAVIGFAVFLAAYGANDNATYSEDAVLVLGCGLKGREVSVTLSRRLDKAVEYHRQNPGASIIVSGGRGPGEDITEALAMAEYLAAAGVPRDKIIQEGRSLSTFENIAYSKPLIEESFGADASVTLITSDFHIYRSERFAQMAGLNVTRLHSPSAWYAAPVNYVRECAAVVKMWIIKK